jgi:hypothetical protein
MRGPFFSRGFAPHPLLLISLREACFARWVGRRSALARPRSRRAKAPEATTQQCGPGWGPSVPAEGCVTDTPPRIRTLGTPWPPEKWPLHPPGGSITPHPKGREAALGVWAFIQPVPQVANRSEARGHRTREPCWGDGGAASCKRRGAPTRVALSGRGRRSLQAQGAGAHKPAASHRGTGKTKALRRKR